MDNVKTVLLCKSCIWAIQSRGEDVFVGRAVQRWEYEDEGKEFKCEWCEDDWLDEDPYEDDELFECIW